MTRRIIYLINFNNNINKQRRHNTVYKPLLGHRSFGKFLGILQRSLYFNGSCRDTQRLIHITIRPKLSIV